VSDDTLRFKVFPVIGRWGVEYIVKEDKIFGKYLTYSRGKNLIKTHKEDATRWKSTSKIMGSLIEAFGNDFTVVDNYL